MKETETLDEERIQALVVEILEPIRDNYERGPISRDRCYEALNALAAAAVLVIKGAGPGEAEARAWFDQALRQQHWQGDFEGRYE